MKINHIILTIIVGALVFNTVPIHARMFSNSSGGAFEGGDGTSSTGEATLSCSNTIEELVILGAKYYFLAHADINNLSENVEISDISGIDFYSLYWAVDSALNNLNMAAYYYRELKYKANQTAYNQVVINKLLAFDYDSFQLQNDGLLKDVFSEVKGYLIKGDVRGVYSRTLVYFDTLINTLKTIKGELYTGKVPANSHMWNLNQTCAKVHMFGQYVTRIFEAIK